MGKLFCELTNELFHQGSSSAVKGDFLLSSDHLIEIVTKLHRISSLAADREKLNVDISDEYAETFISQS